MDKKGCWINKGKIFLFVDNGDGTMLAKFTAGIDSEFIKPDNAYSFIYELGINNIVVDNMALQTFKEIIND